MVPTDPNPRWPKVIYLTFATFAARSRFRMLLTRYRPENLTHDRLYMRPASTDAIADLMQKGGKVAKLQQAIPVTGTRSVGLSRELWFPREILAWLLGTLLI